MLVSEAFILAVLRYRARGGRLYRLAIDHGMSPSLLSATLSGARRVEDPRIVQIGAQLGLREEECFSEDEPEAVSGAEVLR